MKVIIKQGIPKRTNEIKEKLLEECIEASLSTNYFNIDVPHNAYYGFEEMMVYFYSIIMTNSSGNHSKSVYHTDFGFYLPDQQTVRVRFGKKSVEEMEDSFNNVLLANAGIIPALENPYKLKKLRIINKKLLKQDVTKTNQKRKIIRKQRLLQRQRGVEAPKELLLSVDMVLLPYYGEENVKLADEEVLRSYLIKSRQKKSSKTFFAYLTVYSHEKGARQVLSIHLIRSYLENGKKWKREKLGPVIEKMIGKIGKNFSAICFGMDGEFYDEGVVNFLIDQKNNFVIRADYTEALQEISQDLDLHNTLEDGDGYELPGGIAFCNSTNLRLVIVKRGEELVPLILPPYSEITPKQALLVYEERFGIETSYREINRWFVPTSSHSPQYRFALYAMAVFFFNLLLTYHEIVITWSPNPKKWKVTLLEIKEKVRRIFHKILLSSM